MGKALAKARKSTKETLLDTIADAYRTIATSDINGWINHCGYYLSF
ncbi:MAG: hypothetical protein FWG10_14295 [Eubacteriaceae bacterium]|nr:hypothetical protein [Eubacteriaceae bacterium]